MCMFYILIIRLRYPTCDEEEELVAQPRPPSYLPERVNGPSWGEELQGVRGALEGVFEGLVAERVC